MMRISEYIERSNRRREPNEIYECYRDGGADQDLTRIALVWVDPSTMHAVVPIPPQNSPIVPLNYPAIYVKDYFEKRRSEIDPSCSGFQGGTSRFSGKTLCDRIRSPKSSDYHLRIGDMMAWTMA